MRCARALALGAGLCCGVVAHAGTWTRITNNAPAPVNLLLLLSDGTVMAANNNGTTTIGRAWYKLTPNSLGSYHNGTWTTLASMIDTRLYYSAQVLKDGRVFIAGGEYGTGTARAEIYDPVANTWTPANPPTSLLDPAAVSPVTGQTQRFYDANSEILPDGRVLIAPVMPKVSGQPLIYNPATNAWAAGPNYVRGVYQDEATWMKLADNSILTIDPFGTNSERYIPSTNVWVNDGVVPVSLYDPFGFELGGAVLLPNGKAFFIGSTGNTAIYTATGTTSPGTWAAGPVIPGAHGVPDGPCAMMVTGNVLCAVSPIPTSANHFPPPTTFYEYDYLANSFTAAPAPVGANDPIPCYQTIMLDLPDGSVLYSHFGVDLYRYVPTGSPLAAGKPVITSITQNVDGSYHLTGTGLNGISEGASYGDDQQMNSNYPIVRIAHSNGNTYYARTFNWSSTGVMTGATPVTTEYRLPAGFPAGSYSLVVVANGIASDSALAPSVTSGPFSARSCPSGTVGFSVSATGTPTLQYQWRRGTTNLVNGGRISGATSATLAISPVLNADAATNYNCVITNAVGSTTTANVTLTVCVADIDNGLGTGNCDGGVTIDDLLYYLSIFDAGNIRADVDNGTFTGTPDGGITVDDLLYYLFRFDSGC